MTRAEIRTELGWSDATIRPPASEAGLDQTRRSKHAYELYTFGPGRSGGFIVGGAPTTDRLEA